ncbi:EpsG family protein [Porphyromonadaceae bacterium KHP3R9]|nr:EpsG family protein [Porphyromonadaceae bacterium KHP3R9]
MSKIKLQKGTLETIIVFILSPFLSVPFIFAQLRRGHERYMTFLLSIIMGFISFLFIPHYSNDKTRYIERFELFSNFNLHDLQEYFVYGLRPDYIFDFIIYMFAKLGYSYHYFFFFVTTVTVFSIFKFIQKTNETLVRSFNYKHTLLFVILILGALSFPNLLSGIRFFLAGSVFIWAVYFLLINKSLVKGVLFFTVAILTHFSFAFFIPAILLIAYWPKKIDPKFLLLISLIFLFLPKTILGDIFQLFDLSESYGGKVDSYLSSEREETLNFKILTHLRALWVYFSYVYILIINKEKDTNKLFLLFIVTLSFINMTFSVPVVFNRYLIVSKIFFVTYLIYKKNTKSIKLKYFYTFLGLIVMSCLIDLYVLRPNIFASYSLSNMATIVNILSSKFSAIDILN